MVDHQVVNRDRGDQFNRNCAVMMMMMMMVNGYGYEAVSENFLLMKTSSSANKSQSASKAYCKDQRVRLSRKQ